MHTSHRNSTRLRSFGSVILGAVALLAIAWSWMAYGRAAAAPESGPVPAARQTGALLPSDVFTLFLPATYQNLTLQQPIFGVQMNFI